MFCSASVFSFILWLYSPIENSLILWSHLACSISKNLQVERVNSLISVLFHNFLIEVFFQGLIERVCVHGCTCSLGLFLEYTYLFEDQPQQFWCSAALSLFTEKDSTLVFTMLAVGDSAVVIPRLDFILLCSLQTQKWGK